MMNRQRILPLIAAIVMLMGSGGAARAQFTVLHSFSGADGADPYYGAPVIDGNTIYGTADHGGSKGNGVVFALNRDGTGYHTLYDFAGYPASGANPNSSVILRGNSLYGMTFYGGSGGQGTVYALHTDGTGYTNLVSFAGTTTSGAKPFGWLTAGGDTLYGMTYRGGGNDIGTIFSVGVNGTGFSNLYSFAGAPASGSKPINGTLTLAGGVLYGLTAHGGSGGDNGVLFRINPDGTGYTTLYSFTGGAESGAVPYGSLTLAGTAFYGLTTSGGNTGLGTVFRISLDGTGYTNLYSFAGGATSGAAPNGSLTLVGDTLYGTTRNGGTNDLGVLFAVNLDGTSYTNLVTFAGILNGANPVGDLAISDGTLYGWTSAGGSANKGTVFAYQVPEPSTVVLVAMGLGGLIFARRRKM